MDRFSRRHALAFGSIAFFACGTAIGISVEACSSSSSPPAMASSGTSGGGSGSHDGGGSVALTSCTVQTLAVSFGPDSYSAYIPGSTTHTFQIPYVVINTSDAAGKMALFTAADIQWAASDSTKVDLNSTPGAVTLDPRSPAFPSAMVTTKDVGDVDIVASYHGQNCGKSTLHITSATEADWTKGDSRYNSGTIIAVGSQGAISRLQDQDGGADAKCTNCHGSGATMGNFKTVEHTPEQTGGFSDSELTNIFTMAIIPPGSYFDPSVIAQSRWTQFHQWNMTPDQAKGIVIYLRALAPAPQTGKRNFTMGGGRRDAGMPAMPEASVDDGSSGDASSGDGSAASDSSTDGPVQGDAGGG